MLFVESPHVVLPYPRKQLQDFDAVAQEVKRSNRRVKAVVDKFLPQIPQLQVQKQHIDNTIKALEDAFKLGFTKEYDQGQQFNVDPILPEHLGPYRGLEGIGND